MIFAIFGPKPQDLLSLRGGGAAAIYLRDGLEARVAIERIFFQKDFTNKLNKIRKQSKLVWNCHNDHL